MRFVGRYNVGIFRQFPCGFGMRNPTSAFLAKLPLPGCDAGQHEHNPTGGDSTNTALESTEIVADVVAASPCTSAVASRIGRHGRTARQQGLPPAARSSRRRLPQTPEWFGARSSDYPSKMERWTDALLWGSSGPQPGTWLSPCAPADASPAVLILNLVFNI